MKKVTENGYETYDTLEDLFDQPYPLEYVDAWEDEKYYYVRLLPITYYDNSMWKVDKKTKKATCMLLTEFFGFEDKTKHINFEALKETLN